MEIDEGSSGKVPVQQALVNPVLLLSCPVPKHQTIPSGEAAFPQRSPWMTISLQALRGQVLPE